MIFLLNRRYQPYYKWSFRALRNLPLLSELAPQLETVLTTGNSREERTDKNTLIESISHKIVCQLTEQDLTRISGEDLERHAYSVNDRIRNPSLRNLHILAAV